jgi:predicted metal-binding membrane protein
LIHILNFIGRGVVVVALGLNIGLTVIYCCFAFLIDCFVVGLISCVGSVSTAIAVSDLSRNYLGGLKKTACLKIDRERGDFL